MDVFLRVIDRGSLSAAARDLGVSPAAVSNHIRALEDWLGARLLNRTTRQLSLTEAGEEFRKRCEAILTDVNEAEAAAQSLQAAPRGRLRISAPTTFAVRRLGPVVAGFLEQYPETQLDMVLNDRIVDITEEGFDVAIRVSSLADSQLIARRLAVCRFVVCAAPDYLERHEAPEHPSELASHHCLEYSIRPTLGRWLFRGPKGEEITATVAGRLRVNNGDLLRSAAVSGLGVTLAPTFIVSEDLKDGKLIPLLPRYEPDSRHFRRLPSGPLSAAEASQLH